jgi:glycopeptide antibiotics resistance protein
VRKLLFLWLLGWAVFGFPWTGLTSRPRLYRVSYVPFRWARRRDQLLNFAYYVPFGIVATALGWPTALTAGTAAVLSGITELVQVFSVDRFPSVTDLLLNVGGAVVGISIVSFLRSRNPA